MKRVYIIVETAHTEGGVLHGNSRTGAQKVVSAVLKSADKDRHLDVAKMLHVLFVQMNNQ